MKTLISIVIAIVVGSSGAYAESASEGVLRDLEVEKRLLVKQRAEQFSVETAMGNEVHALEKKLLTARRKNKLAQMSSSVREELLMKLKAENRILLEDAIYLSDVYDELRFELDSIVQKAGGGMMADGKVARSANSDDLLQKADSLSNGFDQIEALFGGEVTQAKAIGRQGEVLIGSAYNLGPVSWFLSTTGQEAGILTSEYSGGLPSLNYEDTGDVGLLFNGEPVELDVDLTGGKARAIAAIQSDPLELLKKGGVWLWPILVIALISAFCGIMKFLQLAKIREPDSQWCARILSAVRSDDLDLAKKIAQSCTHPAAEVISTSIGFISAGADVVEEVVYEHLIGVQSHLQKWLPFIAITAATAPLLGLLGTVSGMIRMFNVITITGTGDVKPMAGGISEALVTTLFGLVVAIPALILHTMLSRKSNGVVQNTEKLGLTFVNGLRKL